MTELEPAARPIIARPAEPAPVAYSDLDYTISPETAARLIDRHPANTKRAYDWNWTQFARWCDTEGRIALPATPHTLTDYIVRLIGIGLAPNTIEQVIGTIRSVHADAGYPAAPDTRRTLDVLRQYKREWADQGGRVRKAPPVLLDALRAMVATCDPDTPAGVRDRSLLLIGFNGMCRRSELSGLDTGDIVPAGDEGISVYIRYSKTDRDAQGQRVAVPFGQHAQTCAVRATRAWLALLAERGLDAGPLYRPVDRHGRIGGEPATAGKLALRLTGTSVNAIVRRRAQLAGVEDAVKYTAHGLRAGGATAAYLSGAPVAQIAIHGRWAENSPVVLGYIRAVDEWRNNPMKGIGL